MIAVAFGRREIRSLACTSLLACTSFFASGCEGGALHTLGAHEPSLAEDDAGNEGGAPSLDPSDFDCAVTSPPAGSDPDGLYASFADAAGIFVFSREDVDPRAVSVACENALFLLAGNDDLRQAMVENGARVVVVAEGVSIREVPELAADPDVLDSYRSYGADADRPVTAVSEENVLCLSGDPYEGESLFVHAFAHSVLALGINALDSSFESRLLGAYDAAISAGKWSDTFAASTPQQYFAEGTQSFFDANFEAIPPNGVHGEIDTASELLAYDPDLFGLIDEYFPRDQTFPLCP